MSNPYVTRQNREIGTAQTVTSTGDKVVFTPTGPIEILRWGLVAVVLIDVGAGMVVALDHRPTAASDTGRTEKSTLSTGTTDVAAGTGIYRDLGTPFTVEPGEQIVIEVTDAADTAGTTAAQFFIEFLEKPFVGSDISNMTRKTA